MASSMRLFRTLGVAACVAAGVLGGMMINLVAGRRKYAAAAGAEDGGGGDAAGFVTAGREELGVAAAGERLGVDQPFRELRGALIGKNRKQIARVLGTPTTASLTFGAVAMSAGGKAMTFWDATTWYYPFDQKRRKAIAIRFVRDRAREVEFIGAPG